MHIHIAALGRSVYHQQSVDAFQRLAAKDTVRHHRAVSQPSDADAILLVDLHQHHGDPYLKIMARRQDLIGSGQPKFVYDQRDFPFFTFPGIYASATARMGRRLPVVGGPYAVWVENAGMKVSSPDLLFSFQGARTHRCRDDLFLIRHPRCLIQDTTSDDVYRWSEPTRFAVDVTRRATYAATIARSKFVLCPRGHGPSSFRLYEVLRAGRVPVIISDDWLPPPEIDWPSLSVRVAERNVAQLPRLLEDLEEAWPSLVAAGAVACSRYLDESRLWNYYCSRLSQLARSGALRKRPAVIDLQRVRLWARRSKAEALVQISTHTKLPPGHQS